MSVSQCFEKLWDVYVHVNPKVQEIRDLLLKKSPDLENDHIALRTLRHPSFGIEKLSKDFQKLGYEVKGHYHFDAKKLDAIHLEHATDDHAPKVFISELLLGECSQNLQMHIERALIEPCSPAMNESELLAASGRHWGIPSHAVYQALLDESEYAAWFYVFGFVPNHFTVKVNSLAQFDDIYELNEYLEHNGYRLNSAGGKVKGTPELYLEQSSTMADSARVEFQEGLYEIPSVFYEFAKRYPLPDGVEFSGFIEGNADKIFESTNVRS